MAASFKNFFLPYLSSPPKEIKKELDTLNYLWIGQPAGESKESIIVVGHDISDPLKMAKVCQSPIVFWCLDPYQIHYEEKFKNTKIKVCSIIKHLKKCKNNKNLNPKLRSATTQILSIHDAILMPPRGKIRDFVSFKNIFSLFLLATQGGYIADSSIGPLSEENFFLPHYPDVRVPLINIEDTFCFECWLMYSPLKSDKSLIIFTYFLNGWEESQKILNEYTVEDFKKNYPEEYHNNQGALIINGKRSIKYLNSNAFVY